MSDISEFAWLVHDGPRVPRQCISLRNLVIFALLVPRAWIHVLTVDPSCQKALDRTVTVVSVEVVNAVVVVVVSVATIGKTKFTTLS